MIAEDLRADPEEHGLRPDEDHRGAAEDRVDVPGRAERDARSRQEPEDQRRAAESERRGPGTRKSQRGE